MDPKDTEVGTGSDSGVSPQAQDAGNSQGAQVGEMEQKLEATQAQLKEQRSVQSGLDKQVNELTQHNEELASERERLESEVTRLQELTMTDDVKSEYEQQLNELRTSAADTQSELRNQLDGFTGQVENLQAENERLRVLVGEYPNLAALVEADALPQADTVDDFRAKLDKLAGKFVSKSAADDYARGQGARPPASPPANSQSDLDTLKSDMQAAQKAGDMQKFRELSNRWYEAVDEAGIMD